jgi:hypothetical protein
MRLLKLSLHLLTGFCILFLQYPSHTLAQTHSAQPKERRTMLLSLPSGKMLTVPSASAKEQQYWAEHWQSYADTDSTDAIVMPPGILATMLIPGYAPPKLTQQILDSLAFTHSETLPVYYDTTQHFWKTLWEEHRKEYQSGERQIQNIVVVIRKRGGERLAKDSARTDTPDILAIVPLVNARAYKMPPSASDLVFPYLLTNEAHRNGVYSYGGTPLTRLAVHAEKILLRAQLNKIFLPKEGSRSRDTLYSLIAEEMQKNTIQSTRRMVIPESPVIIFDKLKKTVIRCVVSTGRFFAYPGSFSVKVEGNGRIPKYSVVPESLTSVYGNIDQPCPVSVIFEEPFTLGEHKLFIEYRSQKGILDTGSVVVRVLPASIDAKSIKALGNLKLYFGERLSMRIRLAGEAISLSKQCLIEWQFSNQEKANQVEFTESWLGPLISATTSTIRISIFWKYPLTGESVLLFTKQFEISQLCPEFTLNTAITKLSYHSIDSKEIELNIQNIFMNYMIPIDIDPSSININPCSHCSTRQTVALAKDIKFLCISLDTTNPNVLSVLNLTQQASNQSTLCQVEMLGSNFDVNSAHILIRVRFKKPVDTVFSDNQKLRIQGNLIFRVSASIVNPHNGKEGRTDEVLTVPVNIGQ